MRYLILLLVFVSNLCSAASGPILYWNADNIRNGGHVHFQHKSKVPKLLFSQFENYLVSEDDDEDTLPDFETLALPQDKLVYTNTMAHAVVDCSYTYFIQQRSFSTHQVPIYIRDQCILI